MKQLVRHELRIRALEVKEISPLTPHMVRLTLTGKQLEGFVTAAPDDHVKLLVPANGAEAPSLPSIREGRLAWPEGPRAVARDYTPVRYDEGQSELDLELVLHPGGHITRWLRVARPGSIVGLAGPRGSHVLSEQPRSLLMAGDETALPAVRRWLKELPAHCKVLVLLEVQNERERQPLQTQAEAQVHWYERGEAAPGTTTLLLNALREARLPTPLELAWLAGEADAVRSMKRHLMEERGLPVERISSRGYWKRGNEDHQEPHDD